MRRLWVNAGSAAGFLALSALVAVAGRHLGQPSITLDLNDIAASDLPVDQPLGDPAATSAPPVSVEAAKPRPKQEDAASLALDPSGLERLAPREPLSELSLALPPKPKPPGEWKPTILYRAVAKSAGLIEAMGYTVSIAGIDAVKADEKCTYKGTEWDCGINARTAFRAFLRGRAPACTVPPDPDPRIVVSDCTVGKQDVAEWLVANGWARAAAGGPYAGAQAKARDAGLGIFGPAPDTGSFIDQIGSIAGAGGVADLPESDPPISASVRDTGSIEEIAPPEGDAVMPPVDPPAPSR